MSWQDRPAFMSSEVFGSALRRIREHCAKSKQETVRITFHGGEPCLAGPERFAQWCRTAQQTLQGVCRLELSMQTNGTLLDQAWIEVFRHFGVSVGLSLDGPGPVHDKLRVDHGGRGSYDNAVRGLELLRDNRISFQVLCVLHFGADGLRIHHHLRSLGADRINYLLPDFTHDAVGPIHAMFGPTPCADYLLPILDDWWKNDSMDLRISLFWNMARLILGGTSHLDVLGNSNYQYIFVETDGAIEGLDVLRICDPQLATTGLHVDAHDFASIAQASALHCKVMFEGLNLPTGCRACPERLTCGGGYLPHRYSKENGLDNPTVWCRDMLKLFGRLRELLGVDTQETFTRRATLAPLHQQAG